MNLLHEGQAMAVAPQPHAYFPDHGRSGWASQTHRVSSHTKHPIDLITALPPYSGGFSPGDEIQAVMLAAVSASRALRRSVCRFDPGFRLLAVSLSLIASRANRSSKG